MWMCYYKTLFYLYFFYFFYFLPFFHYKTLLNFFSLIVGYINRLKREQYYGQEFVIRYSVNFKAKCEKGTGLKIANPQ